MTETPTLLKLQETIPLELQDRGINPDETLRWKISDANRALRLARRYPPVPLQRTCAATYEPGVMLANGWQAYELRGVSPSATKYTRGHSSTNVQFGQLDLKPVSGSVVESLEVAIKRIPQGIRGVEEALKNMEVINRGFTCTTQPVAVIKAPEASYILTKTEKDIKTLDQERWNQLGAGKTNVDQYLVRLMEKTAHAIATLESLGIGMTDTQLKNFWVTQLGEIGALDWEHCRFFEQPITANDIFIMAHEDLRHLYWSLGGRYEDSRIKILSNGSPKGWHFGDMWQTFDKLVFSPYEQRLTQLLQRQGNIPNEEIAGIFRDSKDTSGEVIPGLKSVLQESVLVGAA